MGISGVIEEGERKMFDKIVVIILVAICVVTGIWGWWMENGPESKDESKEKVNGAKQAESDGIPDNSSNKTD